MADIELVIKMPEEVCERFGYEYREENAISKHTNDIILDAFCKGTPLPKGHGRLIDEERISLSGIHFETERDHAMMIGRLNSAPTIIEADKEQDDGN